MGLWKRNSSGIYRVWGTAGNLDTFSSRSQSRFCRKHNSWYRALLACALSSSELATCSAAQAPLGSPWWLEHRSDRCRTSCRTSRAYAPYRPYLSYSDPIVYNCMDRRCDGPGVSSGAAQPRRRRVDSIHNLAARLSCESYATGLLRRSGAEVCGLRGADTGSRLQCWSSRWCTLSGGDACLVSLMPRASCG